MCTRTSCTSCIALALSHQGHTARSSSQFVSSSCKLYKSTRMMMMMMMIMKMKAAVWFARPWALSRGPKSCSVYIITLETIHQKGPSQAFQSRSLQGIQSSRVGIGLRVFQVRCRSLARCRYGMVRSYARRGLLCSQS